jgi:Restriction endonuclease fold toxin 2
LSQGGGFSADADAIFVASTKFLNMGDYLDEVQGGLIGDLGSTGAMAGDDKAGRNFGGAYSPAALTTARGIGAVSAGCAAISGKLLTMAWNYLLADDAVAAALVGGSPQLNSAMAPSPEECEPNNAAVSLPQVEQHHDWAVNHLIAPFWPEGNPDVLDAAAATWHRAATYLGEVAPVLVSAVKTMSSGCAGVAFDAFYTYADQFVGLRGQDTAMLSALTRACTTLSQSCTNYADEIRARRAHVEHMAELAGIATVAGVVLSFVTFGLSDGAAAALDEGTASELAATGVEFAEGVAADAAVDALPELDSELEAALRKILLSVPAVTATALTVTAAGTTATTLAAAPAGTPGSATSISAILTAAGIGPIPAPTPPFSPLLTPVQLAAFKAWVAGQPTIAPKPTNPGDLAYQIAVAGNREYVLPTGTAPGPGSTLAVDGIRPSDGALIEAKYVRQPGCTPRTLVGLQSADKVTGFLSPGDSAELAKYGQVLSNPANSQARYLEIDTNDQQAVGYWQFLAAQQGVKTNVRYAP